MKKTILFTLLIGVVTIFFACESDVTEPTVKLGNAYFTSTPAGAQVWLDNKDTKHVTPDTVKNLTAGLKAATLKLAGYQDTSFLVDVKSGKTITIDHINLIKK